MNWCFELLCWRRLLRVPWTARRSNQSILKVISPEYSLEGLMLKLKLQYSGHLMQRTESLETTLMLGKIEGRRRSWDDWMALLTQWIEFEQALGVGDGQGSLVCCNPWGGKVSDTTELSWLIYIYLLLLIPSTRISFHLSYLSRAYQFYTTYYLIYVLFKALCSPFGSHNIPSKFQI